jgi:hypothetical protein
VLSTPDIGTGEGGGKAFGQHARDGSQTCGAWRQAKALQLGRDPASVDVVVEFFGLAGRLCVDVSRGGGAPCGGGFGSIRFGPWFCSKPEQLICYQLCSAVNVHVHLQRATLQESDLKLGPVENVSELNLRASLTRSLYRKKSWKTSDVNTRSENG